MTISPSAIGTVCWPRFSLRVRRRVLVMATRKRPAKVAKVMREYKAGSLHSGKGGKVVKSRRQAVAIAMSEAGVAKRKRK